MLSRTFPPKLSVFAHWKTAPLLDWKNLYGAIEDALFENDRCVIPGRYNGAEWDAIRLAPYQGNVFADVSVEC